MVVFSRIYRIICFFSLTKLRIILFLPIIHSRFSLKLVQMKTSSGRIIYILIIFYVNFYRRVNLDYGM